MNFTPEELRNINTYGLTYTIDEHGTLFIDLPNCIIWVVKRNFYCDRGRFGFGIDPKPNQHKLSIDWADMFPRYFFSLQRAFDEMNDWLEFNKEKVINERNKVNDIPENLKKYPVTPEKAFKTGYEAPEN